MPLIVRTMQLNDVRAIQREYDILLTQIEIQEYMLMSLRQVLYDDLSQVVSGTCFWLGMNDAEGKSDRAEACDALRQGLKQLRLACRALYPGWLKQFRFAEQIGLEISKINMRSGTDVLICSMAGPPISLGSSSQILLFSIVQEAIQNAYKHAAATKIEVSITNGQRELCVTVSDDGCGFESPPDRYISLGIMKMRHRSIILNGEISWTSSANAGTVVRLVIPGKTDKKYTNGYLHRDG